jgi:hypothetical protein
MKNLSLAILITGTALTFTSCKKQLDVNSDPDTPQDPGVHAVFPTQLAAIPRGVQYDARYIGKYVQNFHTSVSSRPAGEIAWDRMGYQSGVDNGGDMWRQTYFGLGKNLNFIIDKGLRTGQWDYVGAAYALKAWSFQTITDLHGEAIFKEAFMENLAVFQYDDQKTIYEGVRSLCDSAIKYLSRTDLNPNALKLSVGDYSYNGDVNKWKKFVYGLLARNYNNLSNKSDYDPAKVIALVDQSFTGVEDDFVIPFDASKNDDANFFGPFRDNLTFFRQSNFIVQLMDGTILAGGTSGYQRDPRIRHMLSMSGDTTNGNGGYRGLNPGDGDANTLAKRVSVMWQDSTYGNPRTVGVFIPNLGKYLFKDKSPEPVMTYAELQFIKAEAQYLAQDPGAALLTYKNAIGAHFDFINRNSWPRSGATLFNTTRITTVEKEAYLAGPSVKQDANDLRLSDIMLQKYISMWGWGFNETWVDLRKYHYNADEDPLHGGEIVYKGFNLPATLDGTNNGKPVYRVRPRYNSEYVWNRPSLEKIGGLNNDYHTYEMWFSKPE